MSPVRARRHAVCQQLAAGNGSPPTRDCRAAQDQRACSRPARFGAPRAGLTAYPKLASKESEAFADTKATRAWTTAGRICGPRAHGGWRLGRIRAIPGPLDSQVDKSAPRPIALQWGGQVFLYQEKKGSSYALATFFSMVCWGSAVHDAGGRRVRWTAGLPTSAHETLCSGDCRLSLLSFLSGLRDQ
jgi:hypothetical protein